MTEQLFHVGVKGLIRNDEGKVLLLKLPVWKGRPSHWDLPGGRMNPGETFEQTLRRELREEIGVHYEGSPKQLMTVLSHVTIPVGDSEVALLLVPYEVHLPEGATITLNPDEPEEDFAWYSPQEAAKLLAVKYTADFCRLVAALEL
jgi:mutator protein MutT